MMDRDYWVKHWKTNRMIYYENPQKQVGRTKNKIPINENNWQKTLNYIKRKLKLNAQDILLDLCSGNGLITIPLSRYCKKVIAVDVSRPLISKIDKEKVPNIKTLISDVRTIKFKKNTFKKVILYFAIQHFEEKEALQILLNVHKWLKKGGIFYIGDIPDADRIWSFFNTKIREKAYFKSIIYEKSIVGNWFTKDFIKRAALYAGYSSFKIIKQPSYQINSHYRFDVILIK